jgi:hypothetical protein
MEDKVFFSWIVIRTRVVVPNWNLQMPSDFRKAKASEIDITQSTQNQTRKFPTVSEQ